MRPPLLLGAARAVLLWERLWPRLWPATGSAGLFAAAALLDLPSLLPGWLHALALLATVGGIGFLLYRGLREFRPPGPAEARHRVETDSGLSHRPLATLDDRLASGDAALWAAHRERSRRAIRNLRLSPPSPGLARLDPRAYRAVVLLLLVLGVGVAGEDWSARLGRAVAPVLFTPAPPPVVDIWITPPAYTGRPVLHLDGTTKTPVEIPVGSALAIQASGLAEAPSLRLGGPPAPFQALGSGTFRTEARVEGGDRIAVVLGLRELGSWPFLLIPDEPPAVRFAEPPSATDRGRLRLPYTAADDYGVVGLAAVVERGDEEERVSLPLAARRVEVKGTAIADLTAHPWAGLPVTLRLETRDAAGQAGTSPAQEFVLPERAFQHPLARYLIERRRRLGADPSPEARREVAEALGRLTAQPERYAGDTTVHLALRSARGRLLYSEDADAIPSARALLWSTALRLEDGGLSEAEQDLARLSDRLRQALDGKGDLGPLAEEMRRGLEQFLAALTREMGKEQLPAPPGARTVDADFLRRMIDEIEQLARAGNREAARQRLADLQAMLRGLAGQARTPEGRQRLAEAADIMKGLRDLAEKQRELLDKTFKALKDSKDEFAARKGTPPPDHDALAAAQEGLKRDLEGLGERSGKLLGEKPWPMDEASQAMEGAAGSLAGRNLEKGVEGEGKALDALRKSLEGVSGMMAKSPGRFPGLAGAPPGGLQDPFGRQAGQGPGAGTAVDDTMKLPSQADFARSRAILEELQRRAGERSRPPAERDYIDRLLRRF